MGVYIKGVTIPEDCWHCAYEGLFPPCGTGAESDYKKTRHPDCPLVEVPESHGRLVDIEDVKKAIFDYHGEDEQKVRMMINAILSSVPTVIEAEEEDVSD